MMSYYSSRKGTKTATAAPWFLKGLPAPLRGEHFDLKEIVKAYEYIYETRLPLSATQYHMQHHSRTDRNQDLVRT